MNIQLSGLNIMELNRLRLLDLFCGVGGWSKGFIANGWECVGVDIKEFDYPGTFIKSDVYDLDPEFINSFDGIVCSPPYEEYARAWLPWLRGDGKPEQWAVDLLQWSVDLCSGHECRLTECSVFSGKHVDDGSRFGSYMLWGDVPALVPYTVRKKTKTSGMKPEKRAEIPFDLAH